MIFISGSIHQITNDESQYAHTDQSIRPVLVSARNHEIFFTCHAQHFYFSVSLFYFFADAVSLACAACPPAAGAAAVESPAGAEPPPASSCFALIKSIIIHLCLV